MLRSLCTFFLLHLCLLGLGQDKVLTVRAELITVDDGLPQGMVWSILQDSTGFLWFATKDGLVRYDGYEYRVFRNVPGDTSSLAGNHITAILEAPGGFLWVGTESDGLHRYDPRTGLFQRIERDTALSDASGIVGLELDPHGDLWIHEYSGALCVVQGAVDKNGDVLVVRAAQAVYPVLRLTDLRAIRSTATGDLWILEQEELSVWERAGTNLLERMRWRVPWPWTEIRHTPGLVHHAAKEQMLLVWERRIMAFDIPSRTKVDSLQLPALQLRGSGLLIDGSGRLWGQGPEGTWFRKDLRTGADEFLRPLLEGGRSVPGNGFFSWTMDRAGSIWAGTPGYGLVKYRSRTERFHRATFSDTNLSFSAIFSSDPHGEELLVHEELRSLNTRTGVLDSIPLIKALASVGMSPTWGLCARDPEGRYWAGGWRGAPPAHLYRFDPASGTLDRLTDGPSDNYTAIYPGMGHEVWALTNEFEVKGSDALERIDTRTGAITAEFKFPAHIRTGTYRHIACWRIASDSTLWMATGNGVYGVQHRTGKWSHFTHSDADSTSIPGNEVFSLCFDPDEPDRYLWVGTEGKGMARMDMRTGECDRQLTSLQGLPNDVIYGILPDARNNLWVSTNQGLCRVDPRTFAMKTYTKADGIAGNEFNRYSAERAADGTLYFGGMEGITWFDPERFYGEGAASPTLITRMKLLNKPVTVSDRLHFLPLPINHMKELVLDYSERMITFEFASMDHSVPDQNEYRYILEGLNDNWIENGTGHEATFTNLDPGSYTFRVQGRNSEGVWDEVGASLGLTITPPWWGTWWYRSLLVLGFCGMIYAFYRYRLARALEVVNVRDRIARDLHDEIGSTLSSVALYSTVAQKRAGNRVPEASAMLSRISESTTAVMEAMNDIVWAVDAENDDMDHVVQRMRAFAVRMTEAGECTLRFEIEKGLGDARIGMSQRKNLYLLFKEAVNNAMKYAACTTIHVHMRHVGPDIVLTVVDDGVGFDPDQKRNGELGGNGMGNMHKRAAAMHGTLSVHTEAGKGTAVELVFRSVVTNKS